MQESSVQRAVWLELGRDCKLFRLNTGKGWVSGAGPVERLKDGSVRVPAARPIALGFARPNGDAVAGAADLIGYTEVKITPEMVGQTIAVFTSIETKRTKGGRASPEQVDWLKQVVRSGGIAGIANSVDSAREILRTWFARF